MNQGTILLVDDEHDVVELVKFNLHRAGFGVLVAHNGAHGLECAKKGRPDVIILDVMMPEMNGHEVCRALRSADDTSHIPIIMLTAKSESHDRIDGLELGADDYVTKPFSPRELVLRTQALFRRTQSLPQTATQTVGAISIDRNAMEVRLEGQKLDLTVTEFRLLCLLAEKRGKTVSRDTLLTDVWGYKITIDTRTVDTHMRRLRKKLLHFDELIETVRGYGYRLRASIHEPAAFS
ncbi:MAG: response regulator transcription factor [Verrucomicrobiales bacterium]